MRLLHVQAIVVLLWAQFLFLVSCGTDPLAGLEGEYCTGNSECCEGLICERSVCLPIELFEGPAERDDLFFGMVRLEEWTGARGGNLESFGMFMVDLSTLLAPYYGVSALDEERLDFGRIAADASPSSPPELDTSHTITSFQLEEIAQLYYRVSSGTLLLPVYYRDDTVFIDYDLPLINLDISIYLPSLDYGATGRIEISGALRAQDSLDLWIQQSGHTYSLWDVLRGDPMNFDTDDDSIMDAWLFGWTGRLDLR